MGYPKRKRSYRVAGLLLLLVISLTSCGGNAEPTPVASEPVTLTLLIPFQTHPFPSVP